MTQGRDEVLELRRLVAPHYAAKDQMHDLSHIDRVIRCATNLARGSEADLTVLRLAALMHGLMEGDTGELRTWLREIGVPLRETLRILEVAEDSLKGATPRSLEGGILHDAHLLEGDENFLVTKALVTGTSRGQSLEVTLEILEGQLGRHRCVSAANQAELERREAIARDYIEKLRPFL